MKQLITTILCLVLLDSSLVLAQNKEWIPKFMTNNSVREQMMASKPKSLTAFLGYAIQSEKYIIPGCETQLGEFKFRVNSKGEVDTITFTGNLQKDLVLKITNNIKDTKNYWQIPEHSRSGDHCWFIFPFFAFLEEKSSACQAKGNESQKNHWSIFSLLNSLMYNQEGILKTSQGYLIRPSVSGPPVKK